MSPANEFAMVASLLHLRLLQIALHYDLHYAEVATDRVVEAGGLTRETPWPCDNAEWPVGAHPGQLHP